MPLEMVTREQLLKFAPKANSEHLDAILENEAAMRDAGILNSKFTLCHFMAQVGAECNYFQIIRESMNYKSVTRIRQVWPARMRKYSDAWIKENLVGNPRALANFVYNGRMGNKVGTDDGWNHIGGGALQCTGKWMTEKYCKKIGIPYRPDILNDCAATFRFACFEWGETGCSAYAEKNDILSISKIINVGSAKSGVMPNGMEHRKAALKKAWSVWGDQREHVPEAADVTVATLRKAGSETVKAADMLKIGGVAGTTVSVAAGIGRESGLTDSVEPASLFDATEQLKQATESSDAAQAFASSFKGLLNLANGSLWIAGAVLGCVAVYVSWRIVQRRLEDARLGVNTGRLFG